MLILVVQIEDHLYAEATDLSTRYESFRETQFSFGAVESESFNSIGATLTQDKSRSVPIETKEKLMEVQPISRNGIDQKKVIALQLKQR